MLAEYHQALRHATRAFGIYDFALAETLLAELDGWVIETPPRIARQFQFPDFAKALAFVNRIGAIAENENHHPDIKLTWGKVGVEIWTHKIGGLTESDFILAAKFDEAYQA